MPSPLESYLSLVSGSGIVGLAILMMTAIAMIALIMRVFFSSRDDAWSLCASYLIFCFFGNMFAILQQYKLIVMMKTGGLGAHDTYLMASVYATLLHLLGVWGIVGVIVLVSWIHTKKDRVRL